MLTETRMENLHGLMEPAKNLTNIPIGTKVSLEIMEAKAIVLMIVSNNVLHFLENIHISINGMMFRVLSKHVQYANTRMILDIAITRIQTQPALEEIFTTFRILM
jgi:hypothetical protein